MQHVDAFRDPGRVAALSREIGLTVTRPWTLMEVCGGQTHAILRYGLDRLLPSGLELIHGPGCPVCVTQASMIDKAIALAHLPDVLLVSFGDMLRVPGSGKSLQQARAEGANVRIIYSPADALTLARTHPDKSIVLFAVGFETTAPAFACVLDAAKKEGVSNLFILCALVCVPPAMMAILDDPDCRVQGFLAAGHVCTVRGYREYEELAERYRVPVVVTGFEPVDILAGVLACVRQLEVGNARVENLYPRVVNRDGNARARELVGSVFEDCDRPWRGIGPIPHGSLRIRENYADWDAERRFNLTAGTGEDVTQCRSADVLAGKLNPVDCPSFGRQCTPEHPMGAPMVSSEGACAAYYRYGTPP